MAKCLCRQGGTRQRDGRLSFSIQRGTRHRGARQRGTRQKSTTKVHGEEKKEIPVEEIQLSICNNSSRWKSSSIQ